MVVSLLVVVELVGRGEWEALSMWRGSEGDERRGRMEMNGRGVVDCILVACSFLFPPLTLSSDL